MQMVVFKNTKFVNNPEESWKIKTKRRPSAGVGYKVNLNGGLKMKKIDKDRVRRYKKAYGEEEGISELTDSEILTRINLEKIFYIAQNKYIENRIKTLNAISN